MTPRPPRAVRGAAVIVVVEGLTALAVAVVLILRGLGGADQRVVNGFGTAVWFVVIGAAVTAAGVALLTGRRWGRGLAIFAQLLLLPVAWYLTAGQPGYGVALGAVALATLVLLLSPPALRWAAGTPNSLTPISPPRPGSS